MTYARLWKPIVVAALIAGTLDLAYAFVHIGGYYKMEPMQILQSDRARRTWASDDRGRMGFSGSWPGARVCPDADHGVGLHFRSQAHEGPADLLVAAGTLLRHRGDGCRCTPSCCRLQRRTAAGRCLMARAGLTARSRITRCSMRRSLCTCSSSVW